MSPRGIIGPPRKGLSGMKCTRCRGPAEIRLPSHNAKFCDECFDRFFLAGVEKGLKSIGFPANTPVAVAVSGGKDSLTAWDALARIGIKVLGIHIDLGNGPFSEASVAAIRAFAQKRGLAYKVYNLKEIFGYELDRVRYHSRVVVCAQCGTLKRSYLNKLAREEGFSVVATGHHLDDESGRLLGNVVRHKERYLKTFYPYLASAHPRQAARIKPLYRMDQHEIRAYCRVHGIEPVQGPGCPHAKGATSHYYQEAMELLEEKMPGSKRDFVFTFLRNRTPPVQDGFHDCPRCGEPTYGQTCGVCRLRERIEARAAKEAKGPARREA